LAQQASPANGKHVQYEFAAALQLQSETPSTMSCQLHAANYRGKIPQIDHHKAAAPEARHNVAQPVEGWGGKQKNSEHRKCDTYWSRIVVGTQAAPFFPLASRRTGG